jgi:hypothetical protein
MQSKGVWSDIQDCRQPALVSLSTVLMHTIIMVTNDENIVFNVYNMTWVLWPRHNAKQYSTSTLRLPTCIFTCRAWDAVEQVGKPNEIMGFIKV